MPTYTIDTNLSLIIDDGDTSINYRRVSLNHLHKLSVLSELSPAVLKVWRWFIDKNYTPRTSVVIRDNIVTYDGDEHPLGSETVKIFKNVIKTRSAEIPRYGFHASTERGLVSAIELPIMLGAGAVQLWMGNNKSYSSKLYPKKTYDEVAKVVRDGEMFVIAHSPYILNFARPLQESEKGLSALQRYVNDLINITNLGGIGSILHMGSNVKALDQSIESAYRTFVSNLEWVVERIPKDAVIILENMAGGGCQMCTRMEGWVDFWRNYVPPALKQRVRWCVDTAHLFAAGEYNLSNRSEVMRFYRDFSEGIGWNYLLCFHFNGSKTKFSSKKDNHADIGPKTSGYIETKGLRQLARIAGATGKPIILEVPTDQYRLVDQFNLIESWF